MEQLEKKNLLKYVKNEYMGAALAAKVARRLHAIPPSQRSDPKAKVTSLALKLITEGSVEYVVGDEADELQENRVEKKGKSE